MVQWSWSIEFAFYYCHRLKLFVYIKKWRRPGVFLPLQALALVLVEKSTTGTFLRQVFYGWGQYEK